MKPHSLTLILLTTAIHVFVLDCFAAPDGGPRKPPMDAHTTKAKHDIVEFITSAEKMEKSVKNLRKQFLTANEQAPNSEAALAACEAYRAKKMEQDQLYKRALDETAALYHITPVQQRLITANPPADPAAAWLGGLNTQWGPQVTESGRDVKLAYRIRGSDGRDHFGGKTNIDPQDPVNGILGITLPDGRTFIPKGTFRLALLSHKLGFLARVLYHESRHFNRLSHGWASINEEEIIAYTDEIELARVFDLNTSDINGLRLILKQYDDAVRTGHKESLNPPAKVEAAWKDYYENQQLNLEEEYKRLVKVVAAKRQQQEAAEERARQEKAAKDKEEAERISAWVISEIQRCEFSPLSFGSDGVPTSFIGYKHRFGKETVSITWTNSMSLDQFTANLFLAHICNGAVNRGQVLEPCNDGIDLINQYSSDPRFMSQLDLQPLSDDSLKSCMVYLRDRWKSPMSLLDIQRLLTPIIVERDKWYVKQRKENEKDARRRANERERQSRDGESSQDRSDDSGGNRRETIPPGVKLPGDPNWDGR